jgi:hypothetical protein
MANEKSDLTSIRTVEFSLVREIYTRRCVSLAIDEYDSSSLSIVVAEESESATLLRFSNPSGTVTEESMVRKFLNRVLELSVRAALEDS